MLKINLLNLKYKNAKNGLTNKEVCNITGLKNYELTLLEQNSLEITNNIEKALNKLQKYEWKKHYDQQKSSENLCRMIIIFGFLVLSILKGSYFIPSMFVLFVLSETISETSWFYYCKRRIESWMKN